MVRYIELFSVMCKITLNYQKEPQNNSLLGKKWMNEIKCQYFNSSNESTKWGHCEINDKNISSK